MFPRIKNQFLKRNNSTSKLILKLKTKTISDESSKNSSNSKSKYKISYPKISSFQKLNSNFLQDVYKEHNNISKELDKIKSSNSIESFSIEKYQNKLINIMFQNKKHFIEEKNYKNLKENFLKINKIAGFNNSKRIKNRWDEYAEKMENYLPKYILIQIKNLNKRKK